MKKLLLGLILCAGLTSCGGNDNAVESENDNVIEKTISGYTRVVEIEGHKYIVARTWGMTDGGICIIHAESCDCKNKNKKDNNDER